MTEREMLQNRDEMLRKYEAKTAAQGYYFGFTMDGNLYMMETKTLHEVNNALKLDRASSARGGLLKIRVRFSKLDKVKAVHSGKAVKLGKVSVMNYADSYNAGEHFEHYVHELNGKTWVKDSVPFNVAGDIEINGKQIQIKYDGAELTNEKTLARA